MSFVVGAIALSLVAVLSLLLPLWSGGRQRRRVRDERQAVIALIRTRLEELAQEREADLLDETAYQQLKAEQERRLLEESGAAAEGTGRRRGGLLLLLVAIVVPLAAFLLYGHLGAAADWQIQQLVERSQRAESADAHRSALNELAQLLERQIERRGDEAGRHRLLLARVQMELGNPAAAAVQYGQLADQFPEDAALAGQYAQALYLANGRQLTAAIRAEAERALQIDPDQTTALGLLGIAAFERGDYAEALRHWRRLKAQLPPGSPNAQIIADGIRRAEVLAGEETPAAADTGPRLAVTVSIDAALKEQVPAGSTLFVFVRAAGGSPMPLAVVRQPVASWPVAVELSDAQSMAAGADLSSLLAAGGRAELVARVTASGGVRPQPGDLEGSVTLTLENTLQAVSVTVDRRL
jgi:cytochrome c-type biogenesis protein CcmH